MSMVHWPGGPSLHVIPFFLPMFPVHLYTDFQMKTNCQNVILPALDHVKLDTCGWPVTHDSALKSKQVQAHTP